MCDINNRAAAPFLATSIMGALITAGMDAKQAEATSHDIVKIVAMNSISHPCWAAEVLGVKPEEQGEDAADDEEGKDISKLLDLPGLSVTMVKVGPNGVESSVGTEDLPGPLRAIIEGLTKRGKKTEGE